VEGEAVRAVVEPSWDLVGKGVSLLALLSTADEALPEPTTTISTGAGELSEAVGGCLRHRISLHTSTAVMTTPRTKAPTTAPTMIPTGASDEAVRCSAVMSCQGATAGCVQHEGALARGTRAEGRQRRTESDGDAGDGGGGGGSGGEASGEGAGDSGEKESDGGEVGGGPAGGGGGACGAAIGAAGGKAGGGDDGGSGAQQVPPHIPCASAHVWSASLRVYACACWHVYALPPRVPATLFASR
jgi:hypothetical protein